MGNLMYLVLAAGLSTIGALVLWWVRHRPRSMQQQMDAFHRELRALRPPDGQATRAEAHVDRVEPMPIRTRAASTPRAGATPTGPRRTRPREQFPDRRRSAAES